MTYESIAGIAIHIKSDIRKVAGLYAPLPIPD